MEVLVQIVRVVNCNVRPALVVLQSSCASSGAWHHGAYGIHNGEHFHADAWKPVMVVSNVAHEHNVQLMRIPKRSDIFT